IHDKNIMIGCDTITSSADNEIHLGQTTKIHSMATDNSVENIVVWDSVNFEVKRRTVDSFGFLESADFSNVLTGTVFLDNGTGAVGATGVTSSSRIMVNHFEPATPANIGILYVESVVADNFVIKSTNPADSNQVNWIAFI